MKGSVKVSEKWLGVFGGREQLGWQYNCIGSKGTRRRSTWCKIYNPGQAGRPCVRAATLSLEGGRVSSSFYRSPVSSSDGFKKLPTAVYMPPHTLFKANANKCNLHIFQIIPSGRVSPRTCRVRYEYHTRPTTDSPVLLLLHSEITGLRVRCTWYYVAVGSTYMSTTQIIGRRW